MPDYGHDLRFGLSITPDAADTGEALKLARTADGTGLDLVAIQDHPYQPGFLDTWTLITYLAARTDRVHFTPNVANLGLRPPALLAKEAATLDVLTGGRVTLGVGSGGINQAVAAMGGPDRTPGQMVEYTEEALRILRAGLDGRTVDLQGKHHAVRYQAGPPSAHPVPLWLGAWKPRMLALTGRLADGWFSPMNIYLPPDGIPEAQGRIDSAAAEAGRTPSDIRRIYNVLGTIGGSGGGQGLHGDAEHWARTLTGWAVDFGIDTFIFWPAAFPRREADRFTGDVVPRVRELVAAARAA